MTVDQRRQMFIGELIELLIAAKAKQDDMESLVLEQLKHVVEQATLLEQAREEIERLSGLTATKH